MMLAAILALTLSLAACGRDEEAARLSDEDRAFVERVVELQQAGDWEALEALVGLTPRACTFGERAMSWNPPCRVGENEGDLVESFAYAGCRGGAHRPGDLGRPFIVGGQGSRLTADARFFGVIAHDDFSESDYHIAFASASGDTDDGFYFGIRDSRIIAQMSTCGGLANTFGPDPAFLLTPDHAD
jgi:hypothetical protein